MKLEWQEMYDWVSYTPTGLPSRWALVDPSDRWMHLGYITRQSTGKYLASTSFAEGNTKTFRSLKQAKAWVQALVLLNQ